MKYFSVIISTICLACCSHSPIVTYEDIELSENYATLVASYADRCEEYEGQFWNYEPLNSTRSGSWFDRGPLHKINLKPGKYKIGYSCDVVFNKDSGKCEEWIFIENPPSFIAKLKEGNKYLVYCNSDGEPRYTQV